MALFNFLKKEDGNFYQWFEDAANNMLQASLALKELCYNFSPEHPLQPARLKALIDLLTTSGLWNPDESQTQLALRPATVDELKLAHSADYVDAVQRLSEPEATLVSQEEHQERSRLALHYGFGDGEINSDEHVQEPCQARPWSQHGCQQRRYQSSFVK